MRPHGSNRRFESGVAVRPSSHSGKFVVRSAGAEQFRASGASNGFERQDDRTAVLIGEDDPEILLLLKLQLRRAGFDITPATSGNRRESSNGLGTVIRR